MVLTETGRRRLGAISKPDLDDDKKCLVANWRKNGYWERRLTRSMGPALPKVIQELQELLNAEEERKEDIEEMLDLLNYITGPEGASLCGAALAKSERIPL